MAKSIGALTEDLVHQGQVTGPPRANGEGPAQIEPWNINVDELAGVGQARRISLQLQQISIPGNLPVLRYLEELNGTHASHPPRYRVVGRGPKLECPGRR